MGYGLAHALPSVRSRPRWGPLERNIVVEIVLLAARARRAGVLRIRLWWRSATAAAAPAFTSATACTTAVGRGGAAPPTPPPRAAATAEHLQLIPDNLGREAFIALLILPLASPETALN